MILNEVSDDSAVVLETEAENGTAGVREEKREIEREGLTENGLDEMREAKRFELSENDEVVVRGWSWARDCVRMVWIWGEK